jgi:hypothetical protein
MNDPFSILNRRYIPWLEYQTMTSVLCRGTLIGNHQLRREDRDRRVNELINYELNYGFVYVGEKKWLMPEMSQSSKSYSDWVLDQFNKVVFPERFVCDCQGSSDSRWEGYTEDVSKLMIFPELMRESIRIGGYLNIFIPGNTIAPDSFKICQAFEILHNISYYLKMAALPEYEDVFLHRVVLERQQSRWQMELINDYGNVGDVDFCDSRKILRAGEDMDHGAD